MGLGSTTEMLANNLQWVEIENKRIENNSEAKNKKIKQAEANRKKNRGR